MCMAERRSVSDTQVEDLTQQQQQQQQQQTLLIRTITILQKYHSV